MRNEMTVWPAAVDETNVLARIDTLIALDAAKLLGETWNELREEAESADDLGAVIRVVEEWSTILELAAVSSSTFEGHHSELAVAEQWRERALKELAGAIKANDRVRSRRLRALGLAYAFRLQRYLEEETLRGRLGLLGQVDMPPKASSVALWKLRALERQLSPEDPRPERPPSSDLAAGRRRISLEDVGRVLDATQRLARELDECRDTLLIRDIAASD